VFYSDFWNDSMTRRDLARHFAERGFTRGAEIGVERGKFSKVLCQSIPGLSLLAVDAWATQPGYREHVTQQELDSFERETRRRLAKYRAHVIKGFSTDVARTVPDGSLCFVYIDARHDEASVLADLMAWMPKVRSGGICSGHDWNLQGVRSAVQDVTRHVSLTLDKSPSWWFTRA
jgi:hypothetical protein